MLASEMAGVSGWPGDWSVTVPTIVKVCPTATAESGAETVVALGPLPNVYIFPSNELSDV